jgi:hypothetical protein
MIQALHNDAVASKQQVVEKDTELLRLGPLVEDAREDGTRRFHVGDILAVMSDMNVSARGLVYTTY